ncbi:MFS transporter [Paenibacillus sp. MY03]|jgi:ACDE family multidrug resistance protein|uniref:MFS transporter n=1 Tax=Paenibacillus sp. MY03 TaxID=302980 RepID=UPI000B3C80BE|nr:MFS transporter [Paenibacillus sp. MY03]OUS77577.1 MFS transporter [Paenibacillus sp. MY03]
MSRAQAHGKRTSSATKETKSSWLQYAAFATVPLVLVLGNSILVPILPDMAEAMSLSKFQSSLVITLFSVSAALFIPIIGYISDRMSRKAVILPALAIYGGAGILAGLGAVWESYGILIGARALQGMAAAGTAPIAMALVGDLYQDGEESEALGLIEASNGAGKVISPILGSLLGLWSWYAPFFAFPLFCAGSFCAVLWLIHEPKHEGKPTPFKTYWKEMKAIYAKEGKWLFTAYLAGSLGLFILFGVLFYLSDMAEKPPLSIDGVAKGGLLAIPLLGLVITAYSTGKGIRKNGDRMKVLMLSGIGLMSLSLTAASIWHSAFIALIIFITLCSIGTGLLLPCLNTLITGSVDRSHRGMVTSLYNSLRFLGVAIGPPFFSWMADKSVTGLFVILTLLSAGLLIAVALTIKPPKRQSKA